jgi:hypothetical protein
MMHSTKGKGLVVVDVMHDASLGGAPGCFGVQRVDAKVFVCSENDERLLLAGSTLRVFRFAVWLLLSTAIPSAASRLPFRISALPLCSYTLRDARAPDATVFVVRSGATTPALQFRMFGADLPNVLRVSLPHNSHSTRFVKRP